ALQDAIEQRVLGQTPVVAQMILGLLSGGHLLLESLPGLGKTLLARVLAHAAGLEFVRIPCTPDLSPTDLAESGWTAAHVVLADEIHRAPPKTQAVLLAGMQEHAITVAGQRHPLPEPQTVVATQVSLDHEQTHPLTEAQLDRFLFAPEAPYPTLDALARIGLRTTGPVEPLPPAVLDRAALLELQGLVRQLVLPPRVADFAARLTLATHPGHAHACASVARFVRFGASPRAVQGLLLGGRAHALRQGRAWVSEDDVRAVAPAVLRHRMALTFEAKLEGITAAHVLADVLRTLPDRNAP